MVKDDITSRLEDRMDGVLNRLEERVKPLMDLVPRPVGSVPVKPIDDLEEYIATIAESPDPVMASERWVKERMAQGYSQEQALTEYVQMVKRNEERIMKVGETGKL